MAGQADRARGLINAVAADRRPAERARLLSLSGMIEGNSGWLHDGRAHGDEAAALSEDRR